MEKQNENTTQNNADQLDELVGMLVNSTVGNLLTNIVVMKMLSDTIEKKTSELPQGVDPFERNRELVRILVMRDEEIKELKDSLDRSYEVSKIQQETIEAQKKEIKRLNTLVMHSSNNFGKSCRREEDTQGLLYKKHFRG